MTADQEGCRWDGEDDRAPEPGRRTSQDVTDMPREGQGSQSEGHLVRRRFFSERLCYGRVGAYECCR